MTDNQLIQQYNYDEFTPEKVFRWLRFDESPTVGQPAPDFPLWDLAGQKTRLSDIWSSNQYTIVEFGSFT